MRTRRQHPSSTAAAMGDENEDDNEGAGSDNEGGETDPNAAAPFDDSCYRDNGLTKGGRLKEDGRVLAELKEQLKKPANVCCRVERFGNVVEALSPRKKAWVREMGLEGLLWLVGCRLPRNLCYWLATHLDCARKELVTADGIKFPLSKVQVHWALGLPFGPQAVPNTIKGKRMQKLVQQIWDSYGSVSLGGTREIKGQAIVEAVECSATNEKEFKRAFLMLALNEVLCPTTCYRLSVKLLPAVTVFDNARYYDWCSLVLNHLLFYAKRFARQFHTHGFARGLGGCTYFLAVFYLDRLKRSPLSWGAVPRIKFWSVKEVNKAMGEDRRFTGDFGSIGVRIALKSLQPCSNIILNETSFSYGSMY